MLFRIGQGFDIHNIKKVSFPSAKPLILGGVFIEEHTEVEAHSDGDTLIHALIDAILGALGKEDIGDLFPPSSKEWKDAKGEFLLEKVLEKTRYQKDWFFGNVDITIVLQEPKLYTKKNEIRQNLQKLLNIQDSRVPLSVKAKTFEKESTQVWVYVSVLLQMPIK